METWLKTMSESERCWHAVLSCSLPWRLWSAACHCKWLIRPCYCNSNRLCMHVCRTRKQIKIFPLYCHSRHLSVSFSVSLSVLPVCVVFVSVCLSVCQPVCQCRSGIFHSSSAARTRLEISVFLFFYFRQMGESLMQKDLLCAVYCLAWGFFSRTQSKWTVTPTGWPVMEPCCCTARTKWQN